MRFTQDSSSSVHVIRAYRPGEIKIDEMVLHASVLVGATQLESLPEIRAMQDLDAPELARGIFARMRAQELEVALIGTGSRQVFPSPEFRAQFLSAGIGIEVMDSGAACRTFNVLVGERRRVVALIVV